MRSEWNEAEFAALFEAVFPSLTRYLEGMLGRSGAAQEIAQESFVRLYRLGPGRIAAGEERYWLYRVATNLAQNELRRLRTRERLGAAIAFLFRSRTADPYAETERADEHDRLLVALGRLPESQRSAFLLREREGLTYDEIAGVLGVSLSKVKVDIHRARATLRAELLPARSGGARAETRKRAGTSGTQP